MAGWWLHVAWIGSIIVLVLMFVTPSDSVRQQASGFYLVRTLALVAAALIMPLSTARSWPATPLACPTSGGYSCAQRSQPSCMCGRSISWH